MKIITAVAAANIATDFENNKAGPIIRNIMEKVLRASMNGERQLHVSIPLSELSLRAAEGTITFFRGLGYKVSSSGTNGNFYYTLYW